MRVGFIGAGRMGRPMVDRLVAAGHEVAVLGRSAQSRESLRAAGARPAPDVAAVAEKADIVCVCVFSDEQVREVALGVASAGIAPSGIASVGDSSLGSAPAGAAPAPAGAAPAPAGAAPAPAGTAPASYPSLIDYMREGSTIVIHTTGSPRTARAIAAAAASRGVSVIDSPVSGGPPDIAAGHITLLVGGAGADVERVRPVLAAYGDPILHVGSLGAGQAVKLVNNAVFAANIGLVAQAVALGEQLGVSEEGLLAALPHGSAASRGLSIVAGRGSVATSARGLAEFLGKDVKVVREVAAELGASLGVLDDAIGALEEVTRG